MSLDLIAQYYDLLYGDFDDDVSMWETLAGDATGPLLEIGCGTGRLLLPLAQAGYTLTGIDLSETALSAAQAKLNAAGLSHKAALASADMRDFDLPYKNFALAIVPLNTFMHCQSTNDQLATLRAIQRHLQPNGQLIVDIFQPDPTLLAEVDGRLYFEDEMTDEITGHTVQWYWRHDIDLAEQMRHLTYILDEIDTEGIVRRTRISFSLRFIYRYEMALLFRLSGFTPIALYGDYDLSPFDSHSPRMIFVAEKTQ